MKPGRKESPYVALLPNSFCNGPPPELERQLRKDKREVRRGSQPRTPYLRECLRHRYPVEQSPFPSSLRVTERTSGQIEETPRKAPQDGSGGMGTSAGLLPPSWLGDPRMQLGKSASLRHRQDSGGISLPAQNPHRSPWPRTSGPPWSACTLPIQFYFLPWPSCQHAFYTLDYADQWIPWEECQGQPKRPTQRQSLAVEEEEFPGYRKQS